MNGENHSEFARMLHYASRVAGRIQFYSPPDPTVSGLAIPPSYKRIRLVLFPPSALRWTLSNDPAPVIGNGIIVSSTMAPIVLRLEDVGDCIQKGFYAVGVSGTTSLGWIEVQDDTLCYKDTPRTNGVLTPWQGHT